MLRYILFLFVSSSLSGYWSVVENVGRGDIGYGRTIVIDRQWNTHVVYKRIIGGGAKGDSVEWIYARRDSGVIYGGWSDTVIWSYGNQLRFPGAKDYTPAIAVENDGDVYIAWSFTDAATLKGDVYMLKRDPLGNWSPRRTVINDVVNPGRVSIAVRRDGGELAVAYVSTRGGLDYLDCRISTDEGMSWSPALVPISNVIQYPSLSYDNTGARYLFYGLAGGGLFCRIDGLEAEIGKVSNWLSSSGDPVTGDIHLAYISPGDSLIYKSHPNGDPDPSSWQDSTILRTGTSNPLSISVIGPDRGITNQDILFEYRAGTWDTIPLPHPVDRPLFSIGLDGWGWGHMIGYREVTSDSVYYLTRHTVSRVIVTPDTIGGTTYPAVPITYLHTVENRGNLLDTITISSYNTSPGWISDIIPDTVHGLLPDSIFPFSVTMTPPDTARPCTTDSTYINAFTALDTSILVQAYGDTSLDTTHIMINLELVKGIVDTNYNFPPFFCYIPGDTLPAMGLDSVSPGDTIHYYITVANTWNVGTDTIILINDTLAGGLVDSIWIVNTMGPNPSSAWVIQPNRLFFQIDSMAPRTADTIEFKVGIGGITCVEPTPYTVTNSAWFDGTPCIDSASYELTHHIKGEPLLMVSKWASYPNYDTLDPGTTIEFWISVTDTGLLPARDVILIDHFWEYRLRNVTIISPPGAVYDSVNRTVTATFPCIAPGSADTIHFRGEVYLPAGTGLIDSIMNTGFAIMGGDTTFSPDTTKHYIKAEVILDVTKIGEPISGSLVGPEDTIRYTITLVNSGNATAHDITVVDTVRDYVTSVVIDTGTADSGRWDPLDRVIWWWRSELEPLDTLSCGYTVIVDSNAPFGDSIPNFAYAMDSHFDTVFSDTTIHYLGRLSIWKGAMHPDTIPEGTIIAPQDTVRYWLRWVNESAIPIFGVTVSDTLDTLLIDTVIHIEPPGGLSGGVITWGIDTLLPFDTMSTNYTVVIADTHATLPDTIWNWCGMESGDDTGSDSFYLIIGAPRIDTLIKSWTYPADSFVLIGDSIAYYLSCVNIGSDTAHNVTIIDTVRNFSLFFSVTEHLGNADTVSMVDSIITWVRYLLAPADTLRVFYTGVLLNDTAIMGDTVVNYGHLFYNADTLSSDTTRHYIVGTILGADKDAVPSPGSWVVPGDTIDYILNLSNDGNIPLYNLVVVDTVSEYIDTVLNISDGGIFDNIAVTWNIDSLLGMKTLSYDGVVELTAPMESLIINWAYYYTGEDTVYSDTIFHRIGRIEITKSAIPPEGTIVNFDDEIRYTVQLINQTSDTMPVRVIDVVDTFHLEIIEVSSPGIVQNDTILWEFRLAPGEANVYFRARVNEIDWVLLPDTVWNFARIESPLDTVDSDSIYHIIMTEPELWLNKSSSPDTVAPGEWVYYKLEFGNRGKYPARGVEVIDTIVQIGKIMALNFIYPAEPESLDPGVFLWRIGDIGPGESDSITFRAQVGFDWKGGGGKKSIPIKSDYVLGYIHNNAWVSSENAPPSRGSTINTVYGGPIWVFDANVARDTARPGDTVQYTIYYRNTGNKAKGVLVTDTRFSGMWLIDTIITDGTIVADRIIWEIGEVGHNGWGSLQYSFVIRDDFKADTILGIIENLAKLTDDAGTEIYADTLRCWIIATAPSEATVSLQKSSPTDNSAVSMGDTIEYLLTVGNLSEISLELTVIDTLDRTYTEPVDIDTFPSYVDGVLRWSGTVPAGSFIELPYSVRVKEVAKMVDTVHHLINRAFLIFADDTISSDETIHYITLRSGVSISPRFHVDSIFGGDEITYPFTVINEGDQRDNITITVSGSHPDWERSLYIEGFLPADTVTIQIESEDTISLSVLLSSPLGTSSDTSSVIVRSERGPADTAFAYTEAEERNIVIEVVALPDAGLIGEGETMRYLIICKNHGNDWDTATVSLEVRDNGWERRLYSTYDTVFNDEGSIRTSPLPPDGGSDTLHLLVAAPLDLMTGLFNTHIDTTLITAISALNPLVKDTASCVTEVRLADISERSIHNYPNPFRRGEGTTFIFSLPRAMDVTIEIYTRGAELMWRWQDHCKAGINRVDWDTSYRDLGQMVAPGVYIYRFTAGDAVVKKNLVVLP
ncbi:DUF11 domain-containing protein [candidate division WOR-3 bacterium]|nr:DUF11 domain-containing protein [candidate division WOR-3 bacterium]